MPGVNACLAQLDAASGVQRAAERRGLSRSLIRAARAFCPVTGYGAVTAQLPQNSPKHGAVQLSGANAVTPYL